MGDEMQADLEDAETKEAEEKRSMWLLLHHEGQRRRIAKQAVAMATAIHGKDHGQT
jgi:hypothetical protein